MTYSKTPTKNRKEKQMSEQHALGEVVYTLELRELQVNHLDEHELSLFYNSLEDAVTEVLENFEVE